jgi:allantoinase
VNDNADMVRDFFGYESTPPKVEWPGEALLALNIVINYKEGSELGEGAQRFKFKE